MGGAKDGIFVVKCLYRELEPRREADFPSKVVWNAWEAVWSKFMTLDNIQKRGWVVVSRCFLCGKEEETID